MVRRTMFAGVGGDDIRNVNVIFTDYVKFSNFLKKDIRRILKNSGNIVLEHTLPLVPLQYGGLRNSARVRVLDKPKGLALEVSFGGINNPVPPTPNAPQGVVDYALRVHEDMDVNHPVGQAKFLEVGSIKSKGPVDRYIKGELKKAPLRKR